MEPEKLFRHGELLMARLPGWLDRSTVQLVEPTNQHDVPWNLVLSRSRCTDAPLATLVQAELEAMQMALADCRLLHHVAVLHPAGEAREAEINWRRSDGLLIRQIQLYLKLTEEELLVATVTAQEEDFPEARTTLHPLLQTLRLATD